MEKKKVYLAQPSNNKQNKSVFLPYSAGCLAAYAFSFEEISNVYDFCGFVYSKETIEKSLEIIRDPAFVGFSCYMWNVEYNLALAKAVKEKYPEAVISFGGPQIPDDTEYLENYDFIDVLTHGEGEIVFYKLLIAMDRGEDFSGIKNISYRSSGRILRNEKESPCDISDFPSPYTTGCFDYIVNDPELAGVQFDTVIETNRGCPFSCIYCYWARSGNRFRLFPIEKVKAEILWMAEKKVSFCVCADSNFGMLDRDEEIADFIIETKAKYGYPEKIETASGKNKTDVTFRINQKFEKAGLNRGISIAVQSMSPKVLEIIGRKNMSFEALCEQLKMYRENDMYTYTDLILGLPGETFESFCSGLFKVIEAGQHYSINVNRCEFLPNTIMHSEEMVRKYKIRTIKSNLCQNHSLTASDIFIGSRSELVVETDSMSSSEWRNAVRLSTMVLAFHCMGLLRFIAVYLRKARNVSYEDFYTLIYRKTEDGSSIVHHLLNKVCVSVDAFLEEKGDLNYSDTRFGNIYWPFEEALFLNCAYYADEFYDAIAEMTKEYSDEAFLDLLSYQKAVISRPSLPERDYEFRYDWPDYFKDIFDENYLKPIKKETGIHINRSPYDNWIDYAKEVVWFGKRSDRMIRKDIETKPL